MRYSNDVIIFDESDWSRGLAPNFGSGEPLIGTSGLTFAENMDPERYPGYLTPGYEYEQATNLAAISGTIVAGAAKNASTAYLGAADGELHELTLSTHTITNAGSWPHAIAAAGAHSGHTTFSADDLIVYRHNISSSLVTSLLYAYNDDTDWDVGRFDFSSAFDDDFMSSVPATPLGTTASDLTGGKGLPHPMEIGADGVLYMASGRYVHGYDGENGANGTFESQVLDLKQGWIITSLLPTESYLLIFAYRPPTDGATPGDSRAECRVFYWDYISPTFTKSDDLADNYVTAAHFYRNRPACFTFGRPGFGGKRGKHRVLSGGRWEQTFGIGDYPVNRGVDTLGDRVILETSGIVYGYGTNNRELNDGLHSLANVSGSTRGLVRTFASTGAVIVSSGSNLDRLASNFSLCTFQTKHLKLDLPPGMKRRIDYVRVNFRKAASGGRNLALTLELDNRAVNSTVWSGKTVTAGEMSVDAHQDTSGKPFPKFDTIMLSGAYTAGDAATDAPVVRSVEVHLKPRKMIKQS